MAEPTPPDTETDAEDGEEQGQSARATEVDTREKGVKLHHGEALTIQDAYRIAARRRVQLIVVAGAADSGKTSLVATLFHCFQRGPTCGYVFAGSDTLLGFDQRCHDARTASHRTDQTMERTKRGEERVFLHLRLCRQDELQSSVDVLFLDLSGEHYREAKDSVEDCRSLPLLQRADHFVVLIDGDRLRNRGTRQAAKNEAMMLLQCCVEAGQLDERSLVDVLISKWDLVKSVDAVEEATQFVERLEESLAARFSSLFGRLRFFRVAARPDSSVLPLGFGLDEVVPSWVEDRADLVIPPQNHQRQSSGFCEYDRFGLGTSVRESDTA